LASYTAFQDRTQDFL